ncbi:MAG: carbonic anhydrase [Acidimicrobiia bacterium]|jgi:carbonic anhydrase|nr:carbonic anhydrase [Acidimicrobiia bacterium]
MSRITQLLVANAGYVDARAKIADGRPDHRLAVVTCMDARIDVFAALGLHLGETLVLRNAGGRVTDDVLRSLALSSHVLGVDTVVVMQHTECGLAGVSDDELRALTGADLGFYPIDDHAAALREDIDLLSTTSYLSALQVIAGFVYDVETGLIDDVVRWRREA